MERNQPLTDPHVRTMRHELSLRSLFSVLAIAAGLWLLLRVWPIILLLIIALILAGTVSPVMAWLEQQHVKRAVALGLILLMLLFAVVGLGALVLPALFTQVSLLLANTPVIQKQLADYLVTMPGLARSAATVRAVQPEQLLAPLATYAFTFTKAAAQVVILGLTTVVLAFYLLVDPQGIKGFAFALLPRRFHLRAARILLDMEVVVGGYVRGQVLTSLLIGLFVFAILWLAGTPSPLALAVFAALADLIPFIGAALALVPAVLATLPHGVLPALLVGLAIGAYLEVESHILIPRIYGQTLRLSSLAVVLALLIGGQLLGIVGALLALPLAAGLRVVVEQWRIDLPGEQPGEATQQALDAAAEASYAAQTEGRPAIEAAELATVMAEQEQAEDLAAPGHGQLPLEARDEPALIPPERNRAT
jgi:predicted PurR-regulated permease PerM